jgi:hypothetical protein
MSATSLWPVDPTGTYQDQRWDYRVRVRGAAVYLWGSAGVAKDAAFPAPPVLHLRNDALGEPVTVSTTTAGGKPTTLGALQPGEQFSIPIQNISGVFASCAFASTVTCWLRHP